MNILDAYSELQNRGFQRLTRWELRDGRVKPLTLDWDDCSGWIYAFVSDRRVRYIGITTTVLRSRLDGYSYQTNDRVCAYIKELLESGAEVEIYGTKRTDESKSELEAEESKLIKIFSTDWNVRE
jgi:hypothetical protein